MSSVSVWVGIRACQKRAMVSLHIGSEVLERLGHLCEHYAETGRGQANAEKTAPGT